MPVRRIIIAITSGSLIFFAGPALADGTSFIVPPNVIFDTDVCLDIDDGMALAILHALHERREAKLVAVTISLGEKWCAPYVSALNVFYGHPGVPIGTVRNGLSQKEAQQRVFEAMGWQTRGREAFAEHIVEQRNADGSLVYPRRLTDGSQASEAVFLLRKTLAEQPDDTVVMIQVGNSTNFARLLDSLADAISDLSGLDLIKKKVRLLSVMGGTFQGSSEHTGVNFYEDIPSAQKVFDKWPTPIVISGTEIGGAIPFPGISIERDFSYVTHHPIAEAYRYSCDTFLRFNFPNWVKKCPHDHHTLDLTAALYALRPDRNYFSLSKPGKVSVLSSGNVRFDEGANGTHRYLIVSEEQKVRAQEAMVMLVSQPPISGTH